ncbi:MAG: hypothetical protein JNL06_00180 [Alphaproteobacteria bacterium]|nr:hypothetical protein [Alphaproteobacteria bacterium]
MSKSIAKLQSWMLWVAGILAILGAINIASLPLKVLFIQVNVLMPIVGLLALASAYASNERALIDAASPSTARRVRIYALIGVAIASFVAIFMSLPVVLPFVTLDMLMLLIGFSCLFFAYIGTRA